MVIRNWLAKSERLAELRLVTYYGRTTLEVTVEVVEGEL
jgi:hypothetical protein